MKRTQPTANPPAPEELNELTPEHITEKAAENSPAPSTGDVINEAQEVVEKEVASAPPSAEPELRIPPILLEGDEPAIEHAVAARPHVATENKSEAAPPQPPPQQLPRSYGTGELRLIARDPGCLYAQWDLSESQSQRPIEAPPSAPLSLRVYREDRSGGPIAEMPVNPDACHCFIRAEAAGSRLVAELGYPANHGQWHQVAISQPIPGLGGGPGPSPEVRFAAWTAKLLAEPLSLEPVREVIALPEISSAREATRPMPGTNPGLLPELEPQRPSRPLPPVLPPESVSLAFLPESIDEELSGPAPQLNPMTELPVWTAAQQRAMAELIAGGFVKEEWLFSAGNAVVVRGRDQGVSLAGPSELGESRQSSLALAAAPPSPRPGFWFVANAELVVYGATQPGATVLAGGRPIQLRPDGTFSYRFAFPDGEHILPLTAVSAEGEVRQVELKFRRATEYSGRAGPLPQEPGLKPPVPEHVI